MLAEAIETTFLYVLIDPLSGETRYVGKSNYPFVRFQNHLTDTSVNHRTNWIRSLKAKGLVPHMELLDEVPVGEWAFWEREYVRLFREIGIPLVNGTSGGDGLFNPSEETRDKIGRAMSKFHLGKPKSPSHCLNISRGLTGKNKSHQHRQKIGRAMSIVNTGRKFSIAHRRKISLARKGWKPTAEQVARQSIAMTGKKQSRKTVLSREITRCFNRVLGLCQPIE